ncbi:MAG: TonB-dependent receptor [Balneolaceae bacterium]
MNRYFFVILLFFAGFDAVPTAAQILQGVVTDENQSPLALVQIEVVENGRQAISREDGTFEVELDDFDELARYTIVLSRVGYEDTSVSVTADQIKKNEKVTVTLKQVTYRSETLVVTATRTRRDIEDVPIPVQLVTGREIRQTGSMRLSDILSEQTGMQIVNDHGTGLQVQGFNPDYTLVMIDGNPVIGRTAGTLDLTRVSVRNVQQIEIVKGPSSALWGSDALAGVVNIITQESSDPFSWAVTTRYGENNTLDLSADMTLNTERWNHGFFANRNSSGGYRMNPSSVSKTVPDFENYTVNYRTDLEMTDRLSLSGSLRYFNESQDDRSSIVDEEGEEKLLDTHAGREDLLARSSVAYTPYDRFDIDLTMVTSFYKTDSRLRFRENGELYEHTSFQQYYHKPEFQAGYRWDDMHHSVLGSGLIVEHLKAERYPGQPGFTTTFAFLQHSWNPVIDFEVTGGLRYDIHSEYRSQVSPKLSVRYRSTDWLQLRVSAGRGFKAPEFRQLFLDFTNSTAGYSVFGSSTVADGLRRLQQEGQISQILIPADQLEEIRAESSWAVNTGFDLDMVEDLRLRINLFRNYVTGLIETAPVARKTNGQSVYSYFNVDEVYTTGMEAELRWGFGRGLHASLGYQLLDARKRVAAERTVQGEDGEIIQRTDISHRPMFNRSRHSGNVKLFYEDDTGWGANIRGIFRGKYGLFDSNGNGYVDDNEHEPGYQVWNAALSRELFDKLTVQAGVDNLLDYSNINVPYLPGRLWYLQASIRL